MLMHPGCCKTDRLTNHEYKNSGRLCTYTREGYSNAADIVPEYRVSASPGHSNIAVDPGEHRRTHRRDVCTSMRSLHTSKLCVRLFYMSCTQPCSLRNLFQPFLFPETLLHRRQSPVLHFYAAGQVQLTKSFLVGLFRFFVSSSCASSNLRASTSCSQALTSK